MCGSPFLDLIPAAPCDLGRDVLPLVAGRAGVYARPLAGFRVAVDSPERYAEAQTLPLEEDA